jgi:hypothetical protein
MSLTTAQFIERAIIAHGDKYDYSKVDYKNSKTSVTIICRVHGEFQQKPDKHINAKHGCSLCAVCANNKSIGTQGFIDKAQLAHGDKYDYSKVDYKNSKTSVTIICRVHGEFQQKPTNHIGKNKSGCSACKNRTRLTFDEFVRRAQTAHGNKYDYSEVVIVNSETPVRIKCPIHGWFDQTPYQHYKGFECKSCGVEKAKLSSRTSFDEFIIKAIAKHGTKYDYSKVQFNTTRDKITIICNLHNEFEQTVSGHIAGRGCYKCGGTKRLDQTEFINRSKHVHGEKYDYSSVDYKTSMIQVTIICKLHGPFLQLPPAHMKGHGCAKCANNMILTTEEFIARAKAKHGDKYDYSQVKYNRSVIKVSIRCIQHDFIFEQTPNTHLGGREGCHKCASSSVSKAQIEWLSFVETYYGIQIARESLIKTTKWRADGYHKDTNTIFEFHGDFWHGNPKRYNSSEINKVTKVSMGELYEQTIHREERIKELGYNLVVVWEHDWNLAIKLVKLIQRKFRSTR